MKKVIVHIKKCIFEDFFKIDEAEVSHELFDGNLSPRLRRLCFERGDSVAAIVYNSDARKVILVNQFKYPTYEKGPGWITEIVAGMLEPDEKPEMALRREVLEEIGYHAKSIEHIASFYVSPGGSSERVFLFYVEVSEMDKTTKGGGLQSEGEDIRIVEVSVGDLLNLLETGHLQDAKTLIAVQWLLKRFDHEEE